MLHYFNSILYNKSLRIKEYETNYNQARLINDLKVKNKE